MNWLMRKMYRTEFYKREFWRGDKIMFQAVGLYLLMFLILLLASYFSR